MGSRAERRSKRQGTKPPRSESLIGQLLLPMVRGLAATKESLFGLVQQVGMEAMERYFCSEAEAMVGRKGGWQEARALNHWGSTRSRLPFGGTFVSVARPRVRGRDGRERDLPSIEVLRKRDPVPERVVEQVLLGVSTRGYGRSLPALPPALRARGASKSAIGRHLIRETTKGVGAFLSKRLEGIEVVALMLDGICVAEQTVVVALGIDLTGRKHPLGLWLGSTENTEVCTDLLHNLIDRGLNLSGPLLVVIDGGKGLRKAIRQVLGDAVLVQRCQVHKLRNVLGYLPPARQAYVRQQMRDAYRSASHASARKRLLHLAGWLDSNGHLDAARSLREGLDETLTVLRLNLPQTLRRPLSTTNAIENLMGTIRRVTRNVKRWKNGTMVHRWVGLAVAKAERGFRRFRGYKDLPQLKAAIIRLSATSTIEVDAVAA